jgi:glycosyltransferase involved in cell wall biosynthesis
MILVSHPTGNEFVRALLVALERCGHLDSFHTTIDLETVTQFMPASFHKELTRRRFPIPNGKIYTSPLRETVRLLAPKFGLDRLTRHEAGWASTDAVYQQLDRQVADHLRKRARNSAVTKANLPSAVYSYEDACAVSFAVAKELGINCFYDLPIAYWQTSRRLLEEEAQRLPAWKATLYGGAFEGESECRDSESKLVRKTSEIELADAVICPSQFVLDSLPETIRARKTCVVTPFGSPEATPVNIAQHQNQQLRVLFAGSMSQRKGLADLFSAIKSLNRSDVQLVVMGALVAPLSFYRKQYADFVYEPPRAHSEVLGLMQTCDILVLPSIVEGRALVQQEAMSCGLPLIVTANAGGSDLIDEGKTGYLVPIRSPGKIAEKINWFADHRKELPLMGQLARDKAGQFTWDNYTEQILSVVLPSVHGIGDREQTKEK